MNIYCDVCRKESQKIKTRRGIVCWTCYATEQKIFNSQDWRDIVTPEYAQNNDMVKRENETIANLANRCKRLIHKNDETGLDTTDT